MANAHRNRKPSAKSTAEQRSTRKVCSLVSTVFSEVLREGRISVRDAARWMHVSPGTVQRYKRNGLYVPMLRSQRIAAPFLRALLRRVEVRNGRAV